MTYDRFVLIAIFIATTFAWRQNPANRKSPILFDTEGLEKWRLEDCKMQERARTMRTTVA